jgi:hypothetical protein
LVDGLEDIVGNDLLGAEFMAAIGPLEFPMYEVTLKNPKAPAANIKNK